jgi:16S rRNA (uracil1498-N3)-methyltransferase
MARYDFRTPRLFVDHPLRTDETVALDSGQAHYLRDVLRLKPGHPVLVFNGHDGEWRAELGDMRKHSATLDIRAQARPQTRPCDLHYLFAPLKRARLDYTVQKAVEMGVSKLQPVLTRHTQAERVNTGRMRANAIEAAEQCGILSLPEIEEPLPLPRAIGALEPGRRLIFCDEDAPIADPIAALATATRSDALAVLIGPEGGFSEDERNMLIRHPGVIRIALGPRILRADTASVAALALVQAALGDWR